MQQLEQDWMRGRQAVTHDAMIEEVCFECRRLETHERARQGGKVLFGQRRSGSGSLGRAWGKEGTRRTPVRVAESVGSFSYFVSRASCLSRLM